MSHTKKRNGIWRDVRTFSPPKKKNICKIDHIIKRIWAVEARNQLQQCQFPLKTLKMICLELNQAKLKLHPPCNLWTLISPILNGVQLSPCQILYQKKHNQAVLNQHLIIFILFMNRNYKHNFYKYILNCFKEAQLTKYSPFWYELEKYNQFIQRQKKIEMELLETYNNYKTTQNALSQFCESQKHNEMAEVNCNGRVIQPFLSSTFRDFFAERESLTNKCFPLTQKLCNSKGLFFAPVDLRWGVTSDQSGSGQVIKICLDEIDRCRPWFLGFLGFRNGWSLLNNDEHFVDHLLEETFHLASKDFPWINQYRDRSVTELEIIHGALGYDQHSTTRNKKSKCVFYFRGVKTLEKIDKNELKTYIDLGKAEAKLIALKKKIVTSGYKVQWFYGVDELVEMVEKDLIEMIENDYPQKDTDPLQHELLAHEVTFEIT
ncbi:hypothetical protein RFI_08022 [Reticulomyxa filosa]|uniref:DUF4062 domain-containing protein n=1 Tax=Reticulomyxa filosa TaxID=46433 RepID=X6NTL5_RETFI|nr:hypothetical protein RFI_08022 [Reticulomyxa filosa]|eukprot:ETO29104.1 hypothetical protein RFI_08022 [Reticulomyxa filosa]